MPLICVHCGMKDTLSGKKYEAIEETMEEHMARCHPDPVATKRERRELERKLLEHVLDAK